MHSSPECMGVLKVLLKIPFRSTLRIFKENEDIDRSRLSLQKDGVSALKFMSQTMFYALSIVIFYCFDYGTSNVLKNANDSDP